MEKPTYTEPQLAALKRIAQQVKSDYASLQESEIIGRIVLITGRDCSKALAGYRMLREVGLLDGFVDRSTEGKFEALVKRNPVLLEFFDRFGCVPRGMKLLPYAGFMPPKRHNPADVIALLNLPEF